MADAAVSFLLDNIKDILLYNATLLQDVRSNVEELHSNLIVFKGFLRETAQQHTRDQTLQGLVQAIRTLVEKSEDVIEKFVVQKSLHKEKYMVKKLANSGGHAGLNRDVALEIESIKKSMLNIMNLQQFTAQAQLLKDVSTRSTAKQAPQVEEHNVVGFEEPAEQLIGYLFDKGKELDIITIVGMAGLGKTTLANKVYTDPTVEYEFFTRAWVYVSPTCTPRDVYLKILNQIASVTERMDSMDENQLARAVSAQLKNGKYLIVLDDVWTKEDWHSLKNAFPDQNKQSRILITSRNEEVASNANPNRPPYLLDFLSSDKSWELLEKRVFGKEKCPSEELEMQGRLIATNCQGLPLAIVVMAGTLLNHRDDIERWMEAANNVNTFIMKTDAGLLDVLALSYNHLSYNLKSCFLYIGVFPKGKIPVRELIRLWIAEGFVEQTEGRCLEDVAEDYLRDLISRSLVMVVDRRFNGQIKSCNMHDMMYEFCKKESEKQNFHREMCGTSHSTLDSYRRICIHSNVLDYIKSEPKGKHVRSFLCFTQEKFVYPKDQASTIPKGFALLRVLDIRSFKLPHFPKELLQLVLLRYIALSSDFKSLPPNISKFWNMQTIIIETSSPILQIKDDFWKLYQLRHLHTNAAAQLPNPPSGVQYGKENVQTLSAISPESCTKEVLGRTKNVRKLCIRGKIAVLWEGSGSNLFDNVGKLENLTNLKLFHDVLNNPGEGKLRGLPQPYNFPTRLRNLTLKGTMLDWKHMDILGKLEVLEVLKLKEKAFKGRMWEIKDRSFLHLKLLLIGDSDIEIWSISGNHLQSLERVVLRHCDKLQSLPNGLANMPRLQLLELYRTSKQAASCARKIQQNNMPNIAQVSGGTSAFKLYVYPPDL